MTEEKDIISSEEEEGFQRLMADIEADEQRIKTDPVYARQQRREIRALSIYVFFHHWPTAKLYLLSPFRKICRWFRSIHFRR